MRIPPSSSIPKLSVCIITYNRAEYLRQTLQSLAWLKGTPFEYEIIVSDNCSDDATASVVSEIAPQLGTLRFSKQAHTVSAEDNLIAAFRMAKGELVVYLADDDALIPEAVASVIDYMDSNPSVVACHCPWELWDEVTSSSHGLSYRIDEISKFSQNDMLKLFDFVIQRHIFPEIGIYRTAMLHKILYQPHKAYWAYVFLARALQHGDVTFLPYAFYRSITRHWVGETREQHGHRQALSQWDSYRGGIEFLLQRAVRGGKITDRGQESFRKLINRFMATRMKVALPLLIARKDYIGAWDTVVRLLPWSYMQEQDVEHYRQFLPIRAAAHAIVATFDAVTTLQQIGLYRISDSEKLVTEMKRIRKDLPVTCLPPGDLDRVVDRDRILVVTRQPADVEPLARAGFGQGLIIVETELLSQFDL